MYARIRNEIEIINPTKKFQADIEKRLTMANPEYAKKKNMGFWVGYTPKYIRLFSAVGNSLILPYGLRAYVLSRVAEFASIDDASYIGRERVDYKSKITPLDYQEPAIQKCVAERNGVLVAPCGSGKTCMGLEIVARIGKRALWITHTHDLLKQSRNRARTFYGIDESTMGSITAGKVDVGTSITFSTVQTLCKINLEHIRDYFDVVIVDECHRCVSSATKVTQFGKAVGGLNARYKYGLTATPDRPDGLSRAMYALLGRKLYVVPQSAVASKTVPIKLESYHVKTEIDMSESLNPDGTLNYPALINAVCYSKERNEEIFRTIKNLAGSTLVLSERVKQCEELCELAKEAGLSCGRISTRKTVKCVAERERLLSELSTGGVQFVFATYQLAKEGLDIPSLKNLVLASPIKGTGLVTQVAGRVMRACDGKEFGRVIDFNDSFPVFRKYTRARQKIYAKLGTVKK